MHSRDITFWCLMLCTTAPISFSPKIVMGLQLGCTPYVNAIDVIDTSCLFLCFCASSVGTILFAISKPIGMGGGQLLLITPYFEYCV